MTSETTYESKISSSEWWVYDILGNIGWIMYITGVVLAFSKKPEFIQDRGMLAIMILSCIPILLIIVGIVELFSERIHKLDRVLSKGRLYRGFGSLTLSGIMGFFVSVVGLIYGHSVTKSSLFYVWLMFIGSILLFIFAYLIFRKYKK
eukprot:jgi/Orpsp1_1/1191962/evm.model.d7180000089652.1